MFLHEAAYKLQRLFRAGKIRFANEGFTAGLHVNYGNKVHYFYFAMIAFMNRRHSLAINKFYSSELMGNCFICVCV